jgi:putative thioredoxin
MTESIEPVIQVTETDFAVEVLERSRQVPVVVDFWAPWCGPCLQLGPVLEELARAAAGAWVLAKVNSDENPELGLQFGVRGIPQVIAFVDGQPVDQFTGALPRPEVESFLARLIPSEVEILAREAVAARHDGDRELELHLWTAVLQKDPEFQLARVRRARLFLGSGDVGPAQEDLESIPEDSEFHTEAENLRLLADWSRHVAQQGGLDAIRERAADAPENAELRYDYGCALALEGKFEDALAEMIEVVRRDREWNDEAGRRALLAMFSFLGDRHALTEEFRTRLARELY